MMPKCVDRKYRDVEKVENRYRTAAL